MIERFDGENSFLSNFYPSIVWINGSTFPTSEHAFQSFKCKNPAEIQTILKCDTPGQAKRVGRKVEIRSNWETEKIPTMLMILRVKFSDPVLKQKLLDTGNQELIEGNDWGDTFWGMCDGIGHNYLGKLLMQVRSELKEKSK